MSTTKKAEAASLSDRIAAVLNAEHRESRTVEALLAEVQPEVARLRQRAAQVREDALDPRRNAADVLALRGAADEADFEAARIERAADVLSAELATLYEGEREAGRLARYERAKARAEATAERIAAEYPGLAEALLMLLAEVAEVTAEVVAVNRDLPEGRDMLSGPEDRARGFALTAGTKPDKAPWLLAEMVLPPLAPSPRALWPRGPNGDGLARLSGTTVPLLDPWSRDRWPSRADVDAALAELAAQTGNEAVAAE